MTAWTSGELSRIGAAEELEVNGLFRIFVSHHFHPPADVHLDAQFFAQFAHEAGLERFSRLTFATRKFPQAAQMDVIEAARDEQLPIAEHQSGSNIDHGRHHRPMLL